MNFLVFDKVNNQIGKCLYIELIDLCENRPGYYVRFPKSKELEQDRWVEKHNGILLMSSGLFDKNRKELYEGDMFRYTEHERYLLKSFDGQIKYNDSQACFGYTKPYLGGADKFYPFCMIDELKEDFLDHVEKHTNIWGK